jgi:hypothetical protein
MTPKQQLTPGTALAAPGAKAPAAAKALLCINILELYPAKQVAAGA